MHGEYAQLDEYSTTTEQMVRSRRPVLRGASEDTIVRLGRLGQKVGDSEDRLRVVGSPKPRVTLKQGAATVHMARTDLAWILY